MAPVGSLLFKHLRIFQVFGANTDVGKTIFSAAIVNAAAGLSKAARTDATSPGHAPPPKHAVVYIKPVSTGPADEADVSHLRRYCPNVDIVQNIVQYDVPVSPHLAAVASGTQIRSDTSILSDLSSRLHSLDSEYAASQASAFVLIESAGGPLSPGPSGSLQADLYRPLRLSTLFIADSRLGGISTSIASYESLLTRGYNVDGVAIFRDDYYKNHTYLHKYFREERNVPFLILPKPPKKRPGDSDTAAMAKYYASLNQLKLAKGQQPQQLVSKFVKKLINGHDTRIESSQRMAAESLRKIWWPFTQHKGMGENDITAIDSAQGDHFQTVVPGTTPAGSSLLRPMVDGSASWWTQGLGHANHDLTMAAAYAAGRYGHVMFAGAIHMPALELSDLVLRVTCNYSGQDRRFFDGVEQPKPPSNRPTPPAFRHKSSRLLKVFYTDNGSTGMEVAVKMALHAASKRYQWDSKTDNIEILGLKGSYHGDTIGCMDLSEPSVYNDKIHWYKGRGFWFDSPTVMMRSGKWVVQMPKVMQTAGDLPSFAHLSDVFSQSRNESREANLYEEYLETTIKTLTQVERRKFGALVMEPVVLGAGGMLLVDPLFQRVLAQVVRRSEAFFSGSTEPVEEKSAHNSADASWETRYASQTWTGLPIVHDEVFTGLYRLGHATPSDLIHVSPDIAVYAKLLTGGLIPLAVTAASRSIFESFLADGKSEALLHGHSYTAHPVGCNVAVHSIKMLTNLDKSGAWEDFKQDWALPKPLVNTDSVPLDPKGTESDKMKRSPLIWSVWSRSFVSEISYKTAVVDGVWALGSVLAISLKDSAGGGYTSDAAKELQQRLMEGSNTAAGRIHCRVLGNVLYLMASQTTSLSDVRSWETAVLQCLV